jgi:hypothetical protein
MTKTDFMKQNVAAVREIVGMTSFDDDNDFGESLYFHQNVLTILFSPTRPTSEFFLKRVHCGANASIELDSYAFKSNTSDFYISSDRNIFG